VIQTRALELDLAHYENATYYDIMHRAKREGAGRPAMILSSLTGLVQNTIGLLAILGLIVSFSPVMAIALFFAATPVVVVKLAYSERMYKWQRERTNTERLVAFYDWMISGIRFAKEIRLFQLGDLFRSRYGRLRVQLRRERLDLARKQTVAELVAQTAGTATVFAAFAAIARGAVVGKLTVGAVVMYYQAFQRGLSQLRQILVSLAGLYEGNLFLSNLYEFLEQKPQVVDPESPRPVPRPMVSGIEFHGVHFRYENNNHEVLTDACLRIAPGEVIALVGENGSGKTTLIKLMCRLYDPTHGAITLDGRDIREYAATELRAQMGVIFQDFAQYPVSARENIWFGDVIRDPRDPAIEHAARKSGIHDTLLELPKGYDSTLGKWLEEGEELSFGQWQKIALARAFLRDAQLIVLDEPTSSLDARSEYEIFCRFRDLLEGRSAILVSHRFSTVRLADRIYVLEHGRVTEAGSHAELVARGGTYARMYELQAAAYRES
jgi:ATP-binding cassette subfamily B protein